MFERLNGLGDDAAAQAAETDFLDGQNAQLRARHQELLAEKAADVRAETLMLLEGLDDISEWLDVPGTLAELSAGVAAQPHFGAVTLQTEPFAWIPHAPAIIREDLSVQDGVRAIRGWHAKWGGAKLPSATILLYQSKNDVGTESPRLAAALSASGKDQEPAALLMAESQFPYKYKELARMAKSYADLDVAGRTDFAVRVLALNDMLDNRKDGYNERRYTKLLQDYYVCGLFDLGAPDDPEKYWRSLKASEFDYVVQLFMDMQDKFAEQSLINPALLCDDKIVYESQELGRINEMLAAPSMRRSRFGFKREISGGKIGEQSWPIASTVPALERQKLAERLEELYLPLLSTK